MFACDKSAILIMVSSRRGAMVETHVWSLGMFSVGNWPFTGLWHLRHALGYYPTTMSIGTRSLHARHRLIVIGMHSLDIH